MFSLSTLLLTLSSLTLTLSQLIPSSPDGSSVYDVGSTITTLWTPDTTGTWGNVTIKLMSGDNFAMVPVVDIATGIDGTKTSSYSFTAPNVTPNSKIYFLQFTTASNATAYEWTTRFTIAAADGTTTAPANSTQPNGAAIPWGVGTLVGSYSTNSGSSTGSSSSNSAVTTSGSITPFTTSSSSMLMVPSSTSTSTASTKMTTVSALAASSSSKTSTSSVASASSTGAKGTLATSGAGRNVMVGMGGVAIAGMCAVGAMLVGLGL